MPLGGTPGAMPAADTSALPGGATQPTSTFYGSQQQNNQLGAGAQTNAGTQLNQYTQGQQGLQAQLPGLLSGILSGQQEIPAYMTAPSVVFKNYMDQFNRGPAHQYAAAYGAGGPQGLSAQNQGLQNLAAQLYQGGVTNFQNFLGQGLNTAFGTPVGQQTANTAANNWQQQGQENTLGYQTGSPLGALGIGGAAAGSILSQLAGLMGMGAPP
jgi:hypothetical protein